VCPAPQFDVLHRRFATDAVGFYVVKLEEAAFGAAAAGRRDKRALATVPFPHRSLDGGRNMS
jgi:hypothetical protein